MIVRDRLFNRLLTARLDSLLAQSCRQVHASDLVESNGWRVLRSFFVFYLLRLYPLVALWLPAHIPQLLPAKGLAPPVKTP